MPEVTQEVGWNQETGQNLDQRTRGVVGGLVVEFLQAPGPPLASVSLSVLGEGSLVTSFGGHVSHLYTQVYAQSLRQTLGARMHRDLL